MLGGDDQELRELRNEWPKMTYEEKVDKFLWKMVWYHHTQHIPGSPSKPIWDLEKTLKEASDYSGKAIQSLKETIKDASDSSEKLTKSIRNATWVAAIIGGLGILIAIANLF